jgi:hypothetical protein
MKLKSAITFTKCSREGHKFVYYLVRKREVTNPFKFKETFLLKFTSFQK